MPGYLEPDYEPYTPPSHLDRVKEYLESNDLLLTQSIGRVKKAGFQRALSWTGNADWIAEGFRLIGDMESCLEQTVALRTALEQGADIYDKYPRYTGELHGHTYAKHVNILRHAVDDAIVRENTISVILKKWYKLEDRIERLLYHGHRKQAQRSQNDHPTGLTSQSQRGEEDHPAQLSERSQPHQEDYPDKANYQGPQKQEDESAKPFRPIQRDQQHFHAKLERALQSLTELLHDWKQLEPDGELSQETREETRVYQSRLIVELAACTSPNELPSKEATPHSTTADASTLQAALSRLTYKPVSKELIAKWADEDNLYKYTSAYMVYENNKPPELPRFVPTFSRTDSDSSAESQGRGVRSSGSTGNRTVDNLVAGVRNVWTRLRLSQ